MQPGDIAAPAVQGDRTVPAAARPIRLVRVATPAAARSPRSLATPARRQRPICLDPVLPLAGDGDG
jgi:hypothetical protein